MRYKYFVCLIGLAVGFDSVAHVRQRSWVHDKQGATDGQESIVHWASSSTIRFSMHSFSSNLANGSSINFSTAQTLMGESIAAWSNPLVTGLSAALNVGLSNGLPFATSNACEFPVGESSGQDEVNNILFTSKMDSSCSAPLPENSGVIGLTRVRYSSVTGEIVEADIQFDDRSFTFLASGSNQLTTNPKQINLKDVAVHELGHFFGLDHSPVRQSSMIFAVAEDLKTPKTDDLSGMQSLYPASNATSQVGRVRGSVRLAGGGDAVFGAVVFLLNARSLEVVASELTDANGEFHFCAVPPGPYVAYVAPYRPFGLNVHSYYSGTGSTTEATYDSKGTTKCFNPGCTLMLNGSYVPTYWTTTPPSASGAGGLNLNVFNVSVANTAEYLNLEVGNDAAEMEAIPAADGPFIELDQPRLARFSSDVSLAGDVSLGKHQYKLTLSSNQSLRISVASMRLFNRLKTTVQLFLASNPSTPVCSKTMTAAEVDQAIDPLFTCAPGSAGDFLLEVSAVSVACSKVPGNENQCATVGESASRPDSIYMVSVSPLNTALTSEASTAISLSGSSEKADNWRSLPQCEEKSALVTKGSESSGGCCGALRGPGPESPWWFTMIWSPAFWFILFWSTLSGLKFARRKTHQV